MDSTEAISRYNCKKRLCHGIDPYAVSTSQTGIPLNVTFPKIYQFLVMDPNPFTGNPKDCSKAMDAILYFKNGWVKNLAGGKVKEIYVVHGKVHHSFALNEKPLEPWILIQEDGTILAAHCNCAIGLLEACSHVGATLFALDGVRTAVLEKKLSVTDLPAYWKKPPASITNDLYKPISAIDLGRKVIRKYLRNKDSGIHSKEERSRDLLNNFKIDGLNVAAMSVFCGDPQIGFECLSCDTDKRLTQAFELFNLRKLLDATLSGISLSDLRILAVSKFEQLPRDSETIELVEQYTRLQNKTQKPKLMLNNDFSRNMMNNDRRVD
ncbi:uncharacterized protein LOC134222719 [Armigeres subalbatus]|uniref:uncharacterized protein LOC134222719 n=1 Tax=Armigeres subalbatus TaxID=124917 RepID=UPI002ED4A54A